MKRETSNAAAFVPPTAEELAEASTEHLRDMVQAVLAENVKLDIAAREARMSAAHYKLQHNLLTIESEEAVKRMEVEHDMTRREVQALQHHGRDSAGYEYIPKLKAYCKSLEEDNAVVYRRLDKAKRVIRLKDEQLTDVKEENSRLLERIRQNREHINVLRSPGGPLYISPPKPSPTTPQQYRATPKQTPMTNRSIRQAPPGSGRAFEALLLADAVLSQENNSAPNTPMLSRRNDPQTPSRHHRGVQSLSSLPTTPRSARPAAGNSTLLPSAQFSPEAEAHVANTLGWDVIQRSRERRRKSRDSTISAPDAEEIARAATTSFREESQEVQESQASQSATEMLRADPRESFEVAASRTATPTPGGDKSSLQQAKIYGSVTKSATEKRKWADEEYITEHSPKKLRAVAGDAIGLGIGFESTRS